jgi:hypothetical protein
MNTSKPNSALELATEPNIGSIFNTGKGGKATTKRPRSDAEDELEDAEDQLQAKKSKETERKEKRSISCTASMEVYATLPVDGNTIRLFLLHPSRDAEAEIEFSLQQASLAASDGEYEALSYAWGELHSTRRIFLRRNGSRLPVDIQENLYNCLLRLRGVKTSRTIWIDAICINQDDLTEKGLQITLMPRIYSGAQQVLAWLGEAANYSEVFTTGQGRSRVCTKAFFRRPYWERTWIIQELLHARAITFQCGSHRISRKKLSEMITKTKQYGELTDHQRRALSLLRQRNLDSWYGYCDGGFSNLLARHSKSKCANKLDIVYALLGILPIFAPALKIPIDYATTTTQLYIRAIDQMDTIYFVGLSAAEGLKRALDLTWTSIIVAMHETTNRLDVSKCLFTQEVVQPSDFSIIDEPYLTNGDPTLSNCQFNTCYLSSSHAWPDLNFRENLYADVRRQESSRFKAREQRRVWATHGSVRRGDLLLNCRQEYNSLDFALVFRSGSDEKWPCIGCAWKPTSPDADDIPVESKTLREYIVSSGLFLHALLELSCGVHAPSRLFALIHAYMDLEDSEVRFAL